MRFHGRTALVALVAALAGVSASATVLPARDAYITPEDGFLKHPKRAELMLPIAVSISSHVKVCLRYSTTLAEPKGKLKAKVGLYRDGKRIESLVFKGVVEKAEHDVYKVQYFRCSQVICSSASCKPDRKREFNTRLRADDVLVFIMNYRKFPGLPTGDHAKVTIGVTH